MTSVFVVAVPHSSAAEEDFAVPCIHRIRGQHSRLHACDEGCQLEGGSGFHSGADGVVEVLPIFHLVLADLVAAEVGDGPNVACGHFANNHGAPGGLVLPELTFQGMACDILQVQIKRGQHIHAFHRIDQVIVGHRHPLVACHAARQLLAFHP